MSKLPGSIFSSANVAAKVDLISFSDQADDQTQQQHFDSMALLLPALSELASAGSEWDSVKRAFLGHDVIRIIERNVEDSEENSDLLKQWKRLERK